MCWAQICPSPAHHAHRRSRRRDLRALSQQFGLDVDPHAPLGDLPMGVRQRVEILKALYRGVDVLILDEPTTMLTPQEVDRLFASLRHGGHEHVIFITHKLPEERPRAGASPCCATAAPP
ncbi:MAG: ATP-binding cassette domain-containing protein [Caldilineaceae bacterium]